MRARGAMPEAVPILIPDSTTGVALLPPAVVEVCEP